MSISVYVCVNPCTCINLSTYLHDICISCRLVSSAVSSLRSIRHASRSSSSVTLQLLVVVLMLEIVGSRAMPTTTTTQSRWLHPCSGETPQDSINVTATANVVDTMSTEEREAVASLLATIAANRLRTVSTSAARLRRLVQNLKIKYVSPRGQYNYIFLFDVIS